MNRRCSLVVLALLACAAADAGVQAAAGDDAPALALAGTDASTKAGLGTQLPEGLLATTVVALLAPDRDASLATLVGVRPWPQRPGIVVAIACIAASREAVARAAGVGPSGQACRADGLGTSTIKPQDVYLGLLAFSGPGSTPRLLASYGKPLDIEVDWYRMDDNPTEWARSGGGELPDFFERFDLANFTVSPTQSAFGLRVAHYEQYGGGGGDFDALLLFVQDGNRLRNVLAQIVGYSTIQAAWDNQGVEDYISSEGQYTIVVLPHQTQGHFDLRMKLMGKRWKMDFAWDATAWAYRPVIHKHVAKHKSVAFADSLR